MSGNFDAIVMRRAMAVAVVAVGWHSCVADEPQATKPAVFELTVSPAAEPVPALKYHLLPPPEELVRGNAAPIYLRVMWERSPDWLRYLQEEPPRLLDVPLADLPLSEAQKVIRTLESELEQFAAAALRSDCDWEYVLEEDPLSTLLPDAQAMRTFARLIVLRARVQLREGDTGGAIASLRTGMALAQNVAKTPFLVTELIGLAISRAMLDELDHVVSAEGAPNLYWALASLPSPVISFQQGLATDRAMLLQRFPELKIPSASIDWPALAKRMRDWTREVVKVERPDGTIALNITSEKLAKARAELPRISDFTADAVAAMSDAEVEVRFTIALFQDTYDQWRKWYLLQEPLELDRLEEQAVRLKTETERLELYPLPSVLVPLQANPLIAQYRVQRLVARQQVIEALRMHAVAEVKFPESLEEVKVVPVPVDPATGKPFAYKLEGDMAVLDIEELAGMTRESLRLPVRITLRK